MYRKYLSIKTYLKEGRMSKLINGRKAYLLGAAAVICTAMALFVCEDGGNAPVEPPEPPVGKDDIYTLKITKTDGGSVSKTPDKEKYAENEKVTIKATADADYNFYRWSGDASGSNTTITVTMTKDLEVDATFINKDTPPPPPKKYSITISPRDGGSVSKDPDKEEYDEDEEVTIRAGADDGYKFVRWTSGLTGSKNPDKVTMGKSYTIAALFELDDPDTGNGEDPDGYYLTVNVSPAKGGTAAPDSIVPEDSEGPKYGPYKENTTVLIRSAANSGYVFDKWTGDKTGTSENLSIVMTGNKTVTAVFEEDDTGPGPTQYWLYLNIKPEKARTSGKCLLSHEKEDEDKGSGQWKYDADKSVKITASASSTYKFLQWEDKDGKKLSGDAAYTVKMDGNKDLYATFQDTAKGTFCKFEGLLSKCYPIPNDDYKTPEECWVGYGDVVEDCNDPGIGVWCQWKGENKCSFTTGYKDGYSSGTEHCSKTNGTKVDSCQ